MLRNVGSNWILLIVSIGTTYIATPLIIHAVGNDGYGVWTLLNSIFGHLALLTLGVPMSCVRYVTQYLALGDIRKANATIGSCAGLYLILGAISLPVAALLAFSLGAFRIPAGLEAQTYLSFAVMSIYVAASFIGLLPEGIMLSHHDFVMRNVVRTGAMLLRLGLTVGFVATHPSLVLLAFIHLACLTFDFSLSLYLIRRNYPGIRISLRDFDWRIVREVLSFGAYVLLLAGGVRLAFETDALIIGAFLDVATIPFYAVANALIVHFMEFIVSIAVVVAPMATQLHTERKLDELRAVFLKWSKFTLWMTLVGGLFLSILGPAFVAWWIHPDYEEPSGQVLRILMISSFVFLPVRGVALPIMMGIGKPRLPALGLIAAGVANIGLSIALARPYGLAGVALGTAIPNVLYAMILAVVTCRELEIGVWRYVGYVVPRASLGALPILALLLWFRLEWDVQSLGGLAIAGVATAFVFAVIAIFYVYRKDPLVDPRPHLARMLVWTRA